MNVYVKRKQNHRHRRQTCRYQRGEGRGKGQIKSIGLTNTTTIHKIGNQ